MDQVDRPITYLCTSCDQEIQLDDVLAAHSDGRRCLCLRCRQRYTVARPSWPSAAIVAQINGICVQDHEAAYYEYFEQEWER